MIMKNLFSNIPDDLPHELFETLVKTDAVDIQRIVSSGHITVGEDTLIGKYRSGLCCISAAQPKRSGAISILSSGS